MPREGEYCERQPGWDGDPSGWPSYVDEMRVWKLGENLAIGQALAALRCSAEGLPPHVAGGALLGWDSWR